LFQTARTRLDQPVGVQDVSSWSRIMNADLSQLQRFAKPAHVPHPTGGHAIPLPAFKWKTRLLLPGLLLVAVAVILISAAGKSLVPSTPVRVVPAITKAHGVSTRSAGGQSIVQAPGWVEPDPYYQVVSALTDGIVNEVLVLEGQRVEAGQVVAKLINDDARLARDRSAAELNEAKARLSIAQAAKAAAQQQWDNPVELQRKVGTAKALLDEMNAELARWPANLNVAIAREKELAAEDERLTKLREAEQAGEIEWVRSRQQHEAQKATVESIRGQKAILEAKIAQMQADYTAASEDLRLRIADRRLLDEAIADEQRAAAAVQRAEAAHGEAQLRLDRMEVRSAVAGVAMNRLVHPGAKVMLGTDNMTSAQILKLYDPAKLQVRVDVPLAEAAQIGVDQPAEIVVGVLPDKTFHGRVSRLVHEADIQKNTIQVKVEIHDPSPQLKPEMLARVRFLALTTTAPSEGEAVFAPESTIHREGDKGSWAWVIGAGGDVVEKRSITLGSGRFDGWVHVETGLRMGERLVVDAPTNLSDGGRVRIEEELSQSSIRSGKEAR
jgi:RND family efflux transporter MFP subunit